MEIFNVSASEYIKTALSSARQESYLGAVLLAGRAADCETFLRGVSRDWSSLHDLTDRQIVVICPAAPGMATTAVRSYNRGCVTRGMNSSAGVQVSDFVAAQAFVRPPKQGIGRRAISEPHYWRRPYNEDLFLDLLSVSTGPLARYFNIAEGKLPSLVLQDLTTNETVAIPVPSCSLYEILREVIEYTSPDFLDAERTSQAEESLRHQSDAAEYAENEFVRNQRNGWSQAVSRVDAHIEQCIRAGDTNVWQMYRERWHQVQERNSRGDAQELLFEMHRAASGYRLPHVDHHSAFHGAALSIPLDFVGLNESRRRLLELQTQVCNSAVALRTATSAAFDARQKTVGLFLRAIRDSGLLETNERRFNSGESDLY